MHDIYGSVEIQLTTEEGSDVVSLDICHETVNMANVAL